MNNTMRRLLYILIPLLLVISCKEEPTLPKQYSFVDETGAYERFDQQALNGGYHPLEVDYGAEYTLTEYKGDQVVGQNIVKNPKKGQISHFVAKPDAGYVTVLIHLYVFNHVTNMNKEDYSYISTATDLVSGKNVEIHVTPTTRLSSIEPIR